MDDLICILALKKIKGLRNSDIEVLLKFFDNPCDIFGATKTDFLKVGLKSELIEILLSERISRTAFLEAIDEIEEASKNGIKIITFNSPLYPSNLAYIKNKPLILYYKGVLKENFKFAVAIAGQRHPPDYSLKLTEDLTDGLCRSGFSIISGLAIGIDRAAHRSALRNNCYTAAFIGSGLLAPLYPQENGDLCEEIIFKSGAIVSEFPLHESVSPRNLVMRDRLQSGSGLGVFAMSSGIKGGTLKTCDFSIKQGRPVFVPLYGEKYMDSKDNEGLKGLIGKRGVSTFKLKGKNSFDLTDIVEELKVVYDELYEEKNRIKGALLVQQELFG